MYRISVTTDQGVVLDLFEVDDADLPPFVRGKADTEPGRVATAVIAVAGDRARMGVL